MTRHYYHENLDALKSAGVAAELLAYVGPAALDPGRGNPNLVAAWVVGGWWLVQRV